MDELTKREQEITAMAARGMCAEAIARELGLSPKTVANALSLIYSKVGVHNRTGLVRWWIERAGLAVVLVLALLLARSQPVRAASPVLVDFQPGYVRLVQDGYSDETVVIHLVGHAGPGRYAQTTITITPGHLDGQTLWSALWLYTGDGIYTIFDVTVGGVPLPGYPASIRLPGYSNRVFFPFIQGASHD